MIDTELDLLRENPSWLAVLQAYVAVFEDLAAAALTAEATAAADQQAGLAADPDEGVDSADAIEDVSDADGTGSEDGEVVASEDEAVTPKNSRRRQPWASRVTNVADVDSEELSRIHGRLIAYGLLKCDLADRTAGVVYQLTTEARRAIETLAAEDSTGNPDSSDLSRSA